MSFDSSVFSTFSFCYPAFFGGIGVALLSGPLGAFLIWQRLVYLGDALAHSSFLGVGLALLGAWAILPSTLFLTLGVTFLLHRLSRPGTSVAALSPYPPSESLLLLLSQGLMGVGLLLVSLSPFPSIDLMAYLVGDLLMISWTEAVMIWSISVFFGLWVMRFWKALLSFIIHPELAMIEGVAVEKLQLIFLIFTSLSLVFMIQITGILLVSMLLVCPTLTLYPWIKTPYGICWGASMMGIAAVLGGFFVSVLFDLPTGPVISVILLIFFGCSQAIFVLKKRLVPLGGSLI
jgi:zinc transport system permease protein